MIQKQARTIGEILVSIGRITQDDVERALAHQRENGGYFGDALVALGLITPYELKWGLADQYNLPFVQLRPDNIDRAVASRVPAAWARKHLMLPVLRAGDSVSVVIADPGSVELLDEVLSYTGGSQVEPSLSTPETIRDLIAAVYTEQGGEALSVESFFAEALSAGAEEIGISVRGDAATGWYEAQERIARPLASDWPQSLMQNVTPFVAELPSHPIRRWSAILSSPEGSWRVECQAIGGLDAFEWKARPIARCSTRGSLARVDNESAHRIRAVLQNGGVTIEVIDAGDPELRALLASEIPLLPAVVTERNPHALHISYGAVELPPGMLVVRAQHPLYEFLQALEPFGLAALTLDLDSLGRDELEAARRVAPLLVFRRHTAAATELPSDFRLQLRARDGELVWILSEDFYGSD